MHLVRQTLHSHVGGLVERLHQVEVATPVHYSNMAVIVQYHLFVFDTMQKVGGVKQLNYVLYSCDKDEATAVIDHLTAERSLQLSCTRWINAIKRVMHILDLIDSDPRVDALVRSCVKATNVEGQRLHPHCLHFNCQHQGCRPAAGLDAGRAARGTFRARCASLLECHARTRQRGTHLQAWTAPLPLCEKCMSTIGTSPPPR